MNKPLISIIVPAYNIKPFLPRCLDSILQQTYTNIEIIVVNDGSTDGTDLVIDEYASKDNRIIAIHKENAGVSSARAIGIQKANGEYIGFVDGDDQISPEMYEHLLGNALKYDADVSHCGYKMIFPDGREDLYYGTGRLIEQTTEQGLYDLLKGEFVEPGLWNKLYKRKLMNFENSPIWDNTIRINEDLLLNYILFSNSEKSIYEDIPLYHYMRRKGSASTSKSQRFKITDPIRVHKTLCDNTMSSHRLHSVIYKRYIHLLIGVATQNDWKEEANDATRTLKNELSNTKFKENCNSFKIRCMAWLTAYAKPIYKIVRFVYDKVTGVSKKYDV